MRIIKFSGSTILNEKILWKNGYTRQRNSFFTVDINKYDRCIVASSPYCLLGLVSDQWS